MASLQQYQSGKQQYWRIVESYRDHGKPKLRVIEYLGRTEDILEMIRGCREALITRSYELGEVYALMDVAEQLDVVSIINHYAQGVKRGKAHVRDGLTVGQSILLAAIGRACHPTSKRGWFNFASGTCLRLWLGPQIRKLNSQHFWDQMDRVPVEAIQHIETEIVGRLLAQENVRLDTLLYDCTNFFTFIASTNNRCYLAKRGKNKQQRGDLRQVDLAMLVSRDGQVPLLHRLYEGSRPDSVVFAALLEEIRKQLSSLCRNLEDLTLVYDKGNNSKKNQTEVDSMPCHYVAGLAATVLPDLIPEANARFKPVKLLNGEAVHTYRVRRNVWGAERTLIVLISETLRQGQIRGLFQHIESRKKALVALAKKLDNPKGKKRDPAILSARIKRMLEGQNLADVFRYELAQRDQGRFSLTFALNQDAINHLHSEVFGRRILMTDQHEWSTAEIIQAYRNQSDVERTFRCLKDPFHLSLRPQYHWTDQKLEVHVFTCVLGYLLAKAVERRVRSRIEYTGDLRHLLDNLKRLRVSERIERTPRGPGKPRIIHELEELEPEITPLVEALGIKVTPKPAWAAWYIQR